MMDTKRMLKSRTKLQHLLCLFVIASVLCFGCVQCGDAVDLSNEELVEFEEKVYSGSWFVFL